MEETKIEEILNATQSLKDLAMNDIEELDELVAENNNDINLETEYPYLIFKRDDLIRAINLCNKIVQPKSDVISYNSISFVPEIETKRLYFYATNELSHFRFYTELLGDTSEMLNINISIPLVILQKLVKLMGNKVLIYKKDINLYIRLLDGDLLLDFRQPDDKIIKFPGEPTEKLADINVTTIGYVVNSILPLLSAEVRGEVRKISFTGEKAYYNSSFYYIEALINSPQMSLSFRDAEFISKIYKYYKDKSILIYNVKSSLPRLFLKVDNIEYQFINSVASISILMTQQMEKVIKPIESLVNFDRLYKIVNLATTLPSSTGTVNLQYNDNKLQASIVSIKGNSDFTFSTELLEGVKLYNKEVLVKSETLRRLLSSFAGIDRIGIGLADLGITLEYKGIKAILMCTDA